MLQDMSSKKKWHHLDNWRDKRSQPRGETVHESAPAHYVLSLSDKQNLKAMDESLSISFLAGVQAFLEGDLQQLDACYAAYMHDLARRAGRDDATRAQVARQLWDYFQEPPRDHLAAIAPDDPGIQVVEIEKIVEKEVLKEIEVIKEVPVPGIVEKIEVPVIQERIVERVRVEPLYTAPRARVWPVLKPRQQPEPETVIMLMPPPAPKLELARPNVDAHASVAAQKVVPGLLNAVGKAVEEAVSTSGRNPGYVHEKAVESLIHALAASIGKGAQLFDLNDLPEPAIA